MRDLSSKSGERGAAFILLILVFMLVLLPVIGLAIDGSICYWMKTKLSAAVDASALAGARSLSSAASPLTYSSTASAVANEYFSANFPPGYMGTSVVGGNPVTTVNTSLAHEIQVTVAGTISVPLYFLRILHVNTATIAATGQSTRRDAVVMLVLDRSYSMQQAGVCGQLITAAEGFVNNFVEGRDEVGLITFQSSAHLDYPPSTTFKTGINTLLNGMVCTGYTTTAMALHMAYQQLQSINQPGALNTVVLFTDGLPDSIDATFPIKNYSDTRYDWMNTSSLVTVGASGCYSSDVLSGILTATSGSPDTTGYTSGIYSDAGTTINYAYPSFVPPTVPAPGCSFPNNYPNGSAAVREDAAYIPSQDNFGNNTTGYHSLDVFPSGDGSSSGKGRTDTPLGIVDAAMNTTDNQANTIRSDTTYSPVVYTIGLGGTAYQQIDTRLLYRIANDPSNPTAGDYNSSQPAGRFVYCTAGGLGAAFAQIASEILHLSK
jgi:Flp pilus assembly protein TadG